MAAIALLQRVRRTIDRYGLLAPGARVVAGVSGGSDSVALALLLLELARAGQLELTALAHFNHRLRPTADRDEAFCRDLAARLRVPVDVESADVAGFAGAQGLSTEDAARRLRYDFLLRVADARGAEAVAVGHTQDDQAETLILKLMRGAGATGLGAIYPRRGRVIRPVLDVTRRELRAFLAAAGESWVEDDSNDDLSIARNRVRHRVIPEMDLAYGGATSASVARAADLLREDSQWLDELADARFRALARHTDDGVVFEATALAEVPAPLRRRILLLAMRRVAQQGEIGRTHVDLAQDVLKGQARGADVPGGRWELRRGTLVLLPRRPARP